ncbi:MAG: DUF4846 domain-containing protein [Flavobacteriales bacterium]|nr:DUF4846 domain-containing protein [Flavobacteriales bacterium]MCB9173721.1 DUF4846 domain-containing protein [Flavobacteriales bacterium]
MGKTAFTITALLCWSFTISCLNNSAQSLPSLPETINIDTTSYRYEWLNYNYKNALVNIITPPADYQRLKSPKNSFAAWLQHLPIKTGDNTVYLFDGNKKRNQNAQFKVLNIDVGDKDLQQCADAVMRLRAEYLYSSKQTAKIKFNYTNGVSIPFSKWSSGYYPKLQGNKVVWVSSQNNASYASFKKYLINIFSYAGTSSLSKELRAVELKDIQIGDVFIKGGFPGHAVIVVDVATNAKTGDKCFMIVQSYMPAQNIHVLKNPSNTNLSPWYSVAAIKQHVYTPEWTFETNELKRFID